MFISISDLSILINYCFVRALWSLSQKTSKNIRTLFNELTIIFTVVTEMCCFIRALQIFAFTSNGSTLAVVAINRLVMTIRPLTVRTHE